MNQVRRPQKQRRQGPKRLPVHPPQRTRHSRMKRDDYSQKRRPSTVRFLRDVCVAFVCLALVGGGIGLLLGYGLQSLGLEPQANMPQPLIEEASKVAGLDETSLDQEQSEADPVDQLCNLLVQETRLRLKNREHEVPEEQRWSIYQNLNRRESK